MAVPVENWNCENMMFETVFDPATNAPRAPTNGASSGQASPTVETAASARVTGIDSSPAPDRKSTRLNSSHVSISYAVFCLKKKKETKTASRLEQRQPIVG